MQAALPLGNSLGLVASLLLAARPRLAGQLARTAAAGDLFIDLPGLGAGAGGTVTAEAVQVMASLYFVAEVEGTFLPAVAEELARNRFTLNLTDRAAAEALEALARRMEGDWVGRDLRNQIYARVFGVGRADANLGDTGVNRQFEPLFARVCQALASAAVDVSGQGAAMRAAVAVTAMLGNLGQVMQGNTLIVTERLSDQLRLSVAAMNQPGLVALFMGRTAWDVVRGVLGTDTPDMTGAVNAGQTGLRILTWIATHLTVLQAADAAGIAAAVRGEPALQGWAEIWLDAAGVPVQTAAPPRSGWLQ